VALDLTTDCPENKPVSSFVFNVAFSWFHHFQRAAKSLVTAGPFSSELPRRIRPWTEDFDHLSVLENNGVLISFGIAQMNCALVAYRLGLSNGILEEMRLMATVAFIG